LISLYVSFAHLSDDVLTEEEMNSVLKKIIEWVPEENQDNKKFLTVLNNLVEITMSNKKFKDTERQMINICAEKWDVDFKV